MTLLIISILALALIGAIVIASLNLLPIGSQIRVDAFTKTQQDVESLRRGAEAFLEDSRDPLTGAIALPEPTSEFIGTLAPNYVFRPRGVQGGVWTAGVAERNGRRQFYFCLSPPQDGWNNEVRLGLLDAISNRFPEGAAMMNSSCGATQHEPGQGARLTYWFPPIFTTTDEAGVAILNPPPAPGDVEILDEDRPVNFRVSVQAMVTTEFNQATPSMAEIFLEVRNPQSGSGWIIIDKWAPSVGISYQRTISASWQGIPAQVTTTINEAETVVTKSGSVAGTVPAGWEVRYRVEESGVVDFAPISAVAHRM